MSISLNSWACRKLQPTCISLTSGLITQIVCTQLNTEKSLFYGPHPPSSTNIWDHFPNLIFYRTGILSVCVGYPQHSSVMLHIEKRFTDIEFVPEKT